MIVLTTRGQPRRWPSLLYGLKKTYSGDWKMGQYVNGVPEEFIGEDPWCIRTDLGETPKSYMYFRYYLTLPPMDRKLSAVAEGLNIGDTWVQNLSSKYKWAERASAYDLVHMPEPDPEGWFVALSGLQTMVVADAFQDYRAMREAWVGMLKLAHTPQDFAHVIRAREILDKMARRMGRMPINYSAKEEKPIDDPSDEDQIYLSEKGPKAIASGND